MLFFLKRGAIKTVKLFCLFSFYAAAFAQSDEIKLLGQNDPLFGKIIIIKTSTIEFKEDSTGFLFEFNKGDVNYIKSPRGDTLWFTNPTEEINTINTDIISNDKDFSFAIKRATVFFSYNFLGSHKVASGDSLGNPDVNSGVCLGIEFDFMKTKTDLVKMGFGAIYQFSRKPINTSGSFNFIPLYIFFKVNVINAGLEDNKNIKGYIIPAIGYNLFYAEKKYSGGLAVNGGFYNSFGFGLLIGSKLDMKLLYQFNRGYLEAEKKIEILYRSLDLHCGYYF